MKEKAECVSRFHETKSPLTVQRNFKREYGRHPPNVRSIGGSYAKFKESSNVGERKRTGKPSVSDEIVDAVCDVFQRSQRKSTRRASHELRILQKRLRLYSYKAELFQALEPTIIPDVLLLLRDVTN
jgi:hypothetical protein